VTPVVEDFVLLRRTSASVDGAVLRGLPAPPRYLRDRIVEGAFDLTPHAETARLVVGRSLADRLGLAVGQTVTLFSMRSDTPGTSLSPQRPRIKPFVVGGIYETSLTTVDDLYIFTDVQTARRLTGTAPDAVHHFDLSVRDITRVDSVAANVEQTLGFPISARTIYQQYSGLFAWINLQEGIVPLVIGVIVLVAAFNIIGALLMLILEKTREVGVLQSLGASPRALQRLFLNVGLLIGVFGTGIGMALALVLGWIQKTFRVIPLPAEAYFMKTAPIELNPVDFVVVGVVTLLLCAAAAYIPARVAARIEPVRAIRFE
jgi:lipoprotein-releasing system permease protein